MKIGQILLATAFVLSLGNAVGAQRNMQQYFGDPSEFWKHPDDHGNATYDGRFTFVRIKYRGYEKMTNEGPGWAHDYPTAESHLMRIMRELSTMRPFMAKGPVVGGNVLTLDDPQLFKFPVAYLSEPGGWHPNEKEAAGMRSYIAKGGFIIVDDFWGPGDMFNFNNVMRAVMPKARLIELGASHPVFDAFFKVDLSLIENRRGRAVYYGVFQDNDPRKRLQMIINYNNDIGDYWQWSDQGFFAVPVSNEAYKLGVNYLIYALTH